MFNVSTSPSILALPMFPRSRKLRRYNRASMGIRWRSIFNNTFFGSTPDMSGSAYSASMMGFFSSVVGAGAEAGKRPLSFSSGPMLVLGFRGSRRWIWCRFKVDFRYRSMQDASHCHRTASRASGTGAPVAHAQARHTVGGGTSWRTPHLPGTHLEDHLIAKMLGQVR